MLDSLIASAYELREINERGSYFVAKEYALIEVNLIWYPAKFHDSLARLRSLSQHILVTFKNNELAKKLASDTRAMADSLAKKAA